MVTTRLPGRGPIAADRGTRLEDEFPTGQETLNII